MMWDAIVVGAYTASLLLLAPRLSAFDDLPTLFVLLAIWSRYLLAGLHPHTYPSFVAGFSLMALHSLLIVAAGFLLVPPRLYFRPFLIVFYILLFLIVFTGVIHGVLMGMVDSLTRWFFFLVVALLLFRAMSKFGVQPILRAILIIAVTPLALQFIGVGLGVRTPDQDGNWAYIAGYFHGGLFSQMLMTCLFVAILIQWRRSWIPLVFVVLCALGVVLANYRTSVLASSPAVIMHIGTMMAQGTSAILRPVIVLMVVGGIAALTAVFAGSLPERFNDVPQVLRIWDTLIKPPHEYTQEEHDLFTGRVVLWATYVYAWINGDTINHFFGFGPGGGEEIMSKHPHNDLVSFLYEFGLTGVLVFFTVFISQALVALQVKDFILTLRLLACLAGYFIINMATSGMNGIEALILFAVLSATIWAYAEGPGDRTTAAPEWPPAPKLIGARWRSAAPGQAADARAPRSPKRRPAISGAAVPRPARPGARSLVRRRGRSERL